MIHLFAIHDKKANSYRNPMAFPSMPEAVRQLTMAAKDTSKPNSLNLFSGDFALVRLGEFDEMTGKITIPNEPEHVCEFSDMIGAA